MKYFCAFTLTLMLSLAAVFAQRMRIVVDATDIAPTSKAARIDTYLKAQKAARDVEVCLVGMSAWQVELYNNLVDSTIQTRLADYMDIDCLLCEDDYLNEQYLIHKSNIVVCTAEGGECHFLQSADYAASAAFLQYFEKDIAAYKKFITEPVALLGEGFKSAVHTMPAQDNPIISMLHAFQCRVTGCDVSVVSLPAFDFALEKGPLSINDINRLVYRGNDLVTISLTEARLKAMLEKIYTLRFYTLRSELDDLVKYGISAYLHCDVRGVQHTVNLTKGSGNRVSVDAPARGKVYRVVMNSYLASRLLSTDTTIEYPSEVCHMGDYRSELIKWLWRLDSPVNPSDFTAESSARLIPERWLRLQNAKR